MVELKCFKVLVLFREGWRYGLPLEFKSNRYVKILKILPFQVLFLWVASITAILSKLETVGLKVVFVNHC